MNKKNILNYISLSIIISLILIPTYTPHASAFTAVGGTISFSGSYKIHTFTTSGFFNITSGYTTIEHLVVAGGGAGGGTASNSCGAGGGGAGGMKESSFTMHSGSYTITIGAGGAQSGGGVGGSGGNSIFHNVTSTGGGGGGRGLATCAGSNGVAGGSGGGGGSGTGTGGSGTGGQGSNGGNAVNVATFGAGGGGGKSAVGGTAVAGNAGNGGNGLASSISGASVTYAGGGGGGVFGDGSVQGTGGSGGGGGGGDGDTQAGTSGTTNTGGGGGGAGSDAGTGGNGGNGGSGIIIVRYINQPWNQDAPINPTRSCGLADISLVVGWTPVNATGVTGYKIWNSSSSSAPDYQWTLAGTVGNVSSFQHNNLFFGFTNYYKISGFDSLGSQGANSTKVFSYVCQTTNINATSIHDVIGNALNSNLTLTSRIVNPIPTAISQLNFYINNTLINSTTLSDTIGINSTKSYNNIWYDLPHSTNQIAYRFSVQNNTQTFFEWTNNTINRDYLPDLQPSTNFGGDSASRLINFTVNRIDPSELILTINRVIATEHNHNYECNYSTSLNYRTGGDWINKTYTGAFNETYTTLAGLTVYVFCYNDEKLFQLISYGNSTGIIVGLAGVENTLGTFFGLPLVFMFILFIASLYSGNRAGMGLLVTMIVTGILSSIGAFVMAENIWGIVLVLASVGLFALRKIL